MSWLELGEVDFNDQQAKDAPFPGTLLPSWHCRQVFSPREGDYQEKMRKLKQEIAIGIINNGDNKCFGGGKMGFSLCKEPAKVKSSLCSIPIKSQ